MFSIWWTCGKAFHGSQRSEERKSITPPPDHRRRFYNRRSPLPPTYCPHRRRRPSRRRPPPDLAAAAARAGYEAVSAAFPAPSSESFIQSDPCPSVLLSWPFWLPWCCSPQSVSITSPPSPPTGFRLDALILGRNVLDCCPVVVSYAASWFYFCSCLRTYHSWRCRLYHLAPMLRVGSLGQFMFASSPVP